MGDILGISPSVEKFYFGYIPERHLWKQNPDQKLTGFFFWSYLLKSQMEPKNKKKQTVPGIRPNYIFAKMS